MALRTLEGAYAARGAAMGAARWLRAIVAPTRVQPVLRERRALPRRGAGASAADDGGCGWCTAGRGASGGTGGGKCATGRRERGRRWFERRRSGRRSGCAESWGGRRRRLGACTRRRHGPRGTSADLAARVGMVSLLRFRHGGTRQTGDAVAAALRQMHASGAWPKWLGDPLSDPSQAPGWGGGAAAGGEAHSGRGSGNAGDDDATGDGDGGSGGQDGGEALSGGT